jgi:tetratricopeptide (TPR) repeat protein
MTIAMTCQCGRKLKANPENAGMKGRCPDCGAVFVIPKPQLGDDGETRMKQACRDAARLRVHWQTAGNLDKAEAGFRQAVAEFGHYWASHYGLANTLFVQFNQNRESPDYTKRSEALSELKKAVTIAAGTQREPLLELARYTASLDIKEGERLYQKALRSAEEGQQPLFPVSWQWAQHFKFAMAAAEAGLNALAIDAFCRALQLDAAAAKATSPSAPKAAVCHKLALKKLGLKTVD